ncbi:MULTISPECIES: TerD family protein [unclassified Deinococcus]|jgi:tellurium resistance protein TerZ|uniref:TerD family protein n=1 Tax=unclassified Deinococcus TaxID=2623546 RepID=UPI001E3BB348|nr:MULTISPECIES: TerD family protein [unclassified Deinococcus]MCD0158543.1 tellurium resistance TerZ family protein [Deinococcus sp. 6GRE01]MCD0170089.1 tellurium resistance TerZ family protein [Deinococcus sp. 23YEL01]
MPISLQKGQQISLAKEAGPSLQTVRMGLGWDAIKKKGFLGFGGGSVDVDLDANALMFDGSGQLVDAVWFRQLQSKDGSVRHSGDNRTGAGDGDDETITVDLTRVPASVQTVVFSVNNYTGQNFSQVDNAYCRLVNTQGDQEIARFNLSVQGDHTAMILASLKRSGNDWTMTAIGTPSRGRTYTDNLPDIRPHL